MKKKFGSACVVAVLFLGLAGFTYYDAYAPREDRFVVELGDDLETNPQVYISANAKALKGTELDFSDVDTGKVGEYKASASYAKKTVEFTVEVKDTTAPEITLVETSDDCYKAVVGQVLKSASVIQAVEDKAGIKSVTFSEGQVEDDKSSENVADRIAMKFDTVGIQEITIEAEDINGNIAEKTIRVKVVEDYLKHVSGMEDMTVERGATIDWMKDVTKDEKVLEVKADASKVDMSKAGEYVLTYTILGDDKETTVTKDVKITVVTPVEAQELANSGGTVKTTGGTKQKKSTSGQGSSGTRGSAGKSSSSGSESKKSGFSGSSSSGKGNSGYKPGQSWEGNKTGEGYIGNGSQESGGNTYEEGTWNPYD